MGASFGYIMMAAAASAATTQAVESRKTRKSAEEQAALERQALADLKDDPAPVIPTGDDEATRRARRRSVSSLAQRRGRQSTILTGDSTVGDPLGT